MIETCMDEESFCLLQYLYNQKHRPVAVICFSMISLNTIDALDVFQHA